MENTEKIAVIGLGYVGLPLAIALGRKFNSVIGFDISESRIQQLNAGRDSTGTFSEPDLRQSPVHFTSHQAYLCNCNFLIVAVPTPVRDDKQPDFDLLRKACLLVGRAIVPGRRSVICFESTVYPGVTRNLCGKWISESSGLVPGVDFHLAYSPERINPGDKEHCLEKVTKIVSGDDAATTERVRAVYEKIVEAGIYVAPSIEVAEAAKILENVQRDVNVALMNEISFILGSVGISTAEVVKAAATKWNFMPYSPGLVGGHCIAVDPYYLIALATQKGIVPHLMMTGRSINNCMSSAIAQKCKNLLCDAGLSLESAKIGVLGLTFKENVPDLRNSLVLELVQFLPGNVIVHDAICDPTEALISGIKLATWDEIADLDCLILAVPHEFYVSQVPHALPRLLKPDGIFIDVKSAIPIDKVPSSIVRWSL